MAAALRHLGIAAHAAQRVEAARQLLEQSTGLFREAGLLAAAAENLVELAYIAYSRHRQDEVMPLLDEAGALARAAHAHRTLREVSGARAVLSG
jgi:hypothetical protein